MSGVSATKGLPPNNARQTAFAPDDPTGNHNFHISFNLSWSFRIVPQIALAKNNRSI